VTALKPIVFLGASTAFHEIVEIVRDVNAATPRWRVQAVLDDDPAIHGTALQGIPVVGPLVAWREYADADFVFAIGSFRTRMRRLDLVRAIALDERRCPALIHPRAKVYPTARVGPGCIVHMQAVVANDADLGAFSIVTFNAVVGPRVRLHPGAMVTTAAVLLTGVKVGSCAFVGAASCVAEDVRIGPGAMVGMGSHVYRNVRPGAYVLGSPARELRRDAVPPSLLEGWSDEAEVVSPAGDQPAATSTP
jgi:sugar O-acyltransferase (sialic acid O-acetyltransferase NeuD family)